MLLVAPLLSKSTFFGSLIHKCRQVIKPSTTTTNNTIKNTNNNNNLTPIINADTVTTIETPKINKQFAKTNIINTSRPAILNVAANSTESAKNRISTTASSHKTYEEMVGLPTRPKRPMTPYFRYMRDQRLKMAADNPKIKVNDMVRQISKQWATVDPKLKEDLMKQFKRDQEAYVEMRAKYDAKITPEQRAEIKELKQKDQESKERRKLRQRIKDLGRPIRPPSAFLSFLKSERKVTPQLPTQTFKIWLKNCALKWTRLTDAEKEVLMNKSRADMVVYKQELAAWEEKMLRAGNSDLVRPSHQIDPPEPKPKKR